MQETALIDEYIDIAIKTLTHNAFIQEVIYYDLH